MMGFYQRASTANPTGMRPWNSRLSFYVPNTFPTPTTGRGPWLLQPGATGLPTAEGGMGDDGDNTTEILGAPVDPTMLGLGIGALLLAVYLFGSGKPRRKARRLRRKISRSQAKLRSLSV